MKKHLSVMMLYVRSILYKFILLVLVMAVVQSVFFAIAFRNAEGLYGLDTIMNNSRLEIIFRFAIALLWIFIGTADTESRIKIEYTLSRLRITRKMVFIWHSIVNSCFIILFRAILFCLLYALCSVYMRLYPQPQAVMLVFYSNNYLHQLLPLKDYGLILYHVLYMIIFAIASASYSMRINKGNNAGFQYGFFVWLTSAFAIGFDIGNYITYYVFLSLMLAVSVYSVFRAFEEGTDE
ncbi:MAG: hypothetical protein FWG88_01365 [Oscillospiraceae bacterium]|nr:hypothetical protein [Oscillospiraceae bacterium]